MIELSDKDKERFWGKVAITANNNFCWNWLGNIRNKRSGYGRFSVKSSYFSSHRVSFFINTGLDPKEKLVMHSCDNRKCCNPNHLSLGTGLDNMRDMINKGRKVSPKWEEGRKAKNNGSINGNAKLTESDVLKMRDEYIEGVTTYLYLSKKYKVSEEIARKAIKKISWKHI
jgi:hypothetical protein